MRINQVDYKTNLIDIHNIRSLLFNHFYVNMNYIESLKNIIAKHIECLAIDYSVSEFVFTIRIKKTAMKKDHKFVHDPNYYYHIIPNIFREFISINSNALADVLRNSNINSNESPEIIVGKLLDPTLGGYYCLSNLCSISCIADNILIFKL